MHMVDKTRSWLRGNHIHVNDDWLKACVEWIEEENSGHGLTDGDINAQVYEQWLLADLHELETCCLPPEVVSAQKYELSGTYALQIDSIVDVGVSFYSQQQKLKGTENANVHINADEPTQKPWEPKPSRMLMFKLTDGMYCVQGMEYRPISCLSPQTSPGAKILVHGNVLCRHGVLMLSDSNIRFLGGEVDTLVEANTILSTLQSAMEASEEHSGKEHKQTYSGSQVRHNKQAGGGNQLNQGNQLNAWGSSSNFQRSSQFSQNQKPDVKPQGKVKLEPVSQSGGVRNNIDNNQNLSDYDAFLDDDMEDLMEQMDTDVFQQPQTQNVQNSNSNQFVTNNTTTFNQNTNKRSSLSVQTRNSGVKTSYSQRTNNMCNRNEENSSYKLSNQIPGKVSHGNSMLLDDDLVAMEFEDDMDFPPMDDEFMTSSDTHNATSKHSSDNSSVSVSSNLGNNFRSPCDPIVLKSSVNQMNNPPSCISHSVGMTERTNVSAISRKSESDISNVILPGDKISAKTKLSLAKLKTEATGRSSAGTPSAKSLKVQQRSIENFLTPNKTGKQEKTDDGSRGKTSQDIQTEYPFTYLAKVMSLPALENPTYHTVKAYISTLTSKLSTASGKWTLSCKINDGTMALDVDLSNQVLTEMIGFSPKEAQEMKLRVKTDPSVKEVLQEGIQQCQQKLIELMCLLELEVCAQSPRPVIIATKQLTSHHIDMLYNRVMASWNSNT